MPARPLPPPPRSDIRRIVGRVPIVRQCWRAVQTMIGWGTVRLREGAAGRQWVQITRGQHEIYGDAHVAEPQGFTSGVGPGAIGVVLKPGGRGERVIVINPARYQQRPRYVDDDAACVWTPHQSRLFLDEHGDVELGAGLTDYRETAEFLDEGAKLRLRHDGELEVYSETEIRLRCQPKGGEGTSATVVMRPDGTLEVTTDADVSVTAAGSVEVSSDQSVSVEALGDVTVEADGEVEVTAAAVTLRNTAGAELRLDGAKVVAVPGPGGAVELGGEGGDAVALASQVEARLADLKAAYLLHTHTAPQGGGVTTVAQGDVPGDEPVGAQRVRGQ